MPTAPKKAASAGWCKYSPFVEQSGVSQQVIEKINQTNTQGAYDPVLDELNSLLLPMYLCPSDPGLKDQEEKYGNKNRKGMSYAGVSGSYYSRTGICPSTRNGSDDCVWSNPSDTDLLGPNNYDGLLIMDWPVELRQATDGLSNTLMIGERTYQIRAWILGAYWVGRTDPPRGRGASGPPSGPQPATVFFACKNINDKAMLNHDPLNGCYVGHDNDKGDHPTVSASTPRTLSVNNLPFASFHPGGVNFARGDGGIRFLNDSLDVKIYLALGSRNGGEIVTE